MTIDRLKIGNDFSSYSDDSSSDDGDNTSDEDGKSSQPSQQNISGPDTAGLEVGDSQSISKAPSVAPPTLRAILCEFLDRSNTAEQEPDIGFRLTNLSEHICASRPLVDWLASALDHTFYLHLPLTINHALLFGSLVGRLRVKLEGQRVISVVVSKVNVYRTRKASLLASVSYQIFLDLELENLEEKLYNDLVASLRGMNDAWKEITLWALLRCLLMAIPQRPHALLVICFGDSSPSIDEISIINMIIDFRNNLSKSLGIFVASQTKIFPSVDYPFQLHLNPDSTEVRAACSRDLDSWITYLTEMRPSLKNLDSLDMSNLVDLYPDYLAFASCFERLQTKSWITKRGFQLDRELTSRPETLFFHFLAMIPKRERPFVGGTLALVRSAARLFTVPELEAAHMMIRAEMDSYHIKKNVVLDIEFDLRHSLAGLIRIQGNSVCYSHPAIQAVLDSRSQSPPPSWIMTRKESDMKLAIICLRYISAWADDHGGSQIENPKVMAEQWPMLNYAVKHWLLHYHRAAFSDAKSSVVRSYVENWDFIKTLMNLWFDMHPVYARPQELTERLSPIEIAKSFKLTICEAMKVTFIASIILPVVGNDEDAAILWSIGTLDRSKIVGTSWTEKIKNPSIMASLLRALDYDPLSTFHLLLEADTAFITENAPAIFTVGVTQGVTEIVEHFIARETFIEKSVLQNAWLSCARYGHTNIMRKLIVFETAITGSEGPEDPTALHETVRWGNLESMELLLECELGHGAVKETYGRAIAIASERGLVGFLGPLLKHHPDLAQGDHGSTSLQHASFRDDGLIAALLIEHGVRITIEDEEGILPLGLAVQHNNKEMTKVLLDAIEPSNGNSFSTGLRTAKSNEGGRGTTSSEYYKLLKEAIYHGHENLTILLLEHDITVATNALLGVAARQDCKELVQRLLKFDSIDIDHQDPENYWRTALQYATWWEKTAAMRVLLDHGANTLTTNKWGASPLEDAAYTGNEEAVRLLLERHYHDSYLHKALIEAVQRGKESIVPILLDAGANKDHADRNGDRALHWAAHNGSSAIVRTLLLRYAELDCQNANGETPLSLAAQRNVEIVKLLLDAGTSVQIKNREGRTPLHRAAFEDAVNIVDLLLQKGAEVTADPTCRGDNLLEQLSSIDALNTVRLLLDREQPTDKALLSNCFYNALCSKQRRIISLFREYEPDPNLKSGNPIYGSALQEFCFDGNFTAVRELLECPIPADVNKTGGKYYTALIAAVCESDQSLSMENERNRRRHRKSVLKRQKMLEHLSDRGADWTVSGGQYGTVLGAAVTRASPELMAFVLSKVSVTLEDHEGRSAAHLIANDRSNREEKLQILSENVNLGKLDLKDRQGRMPLHFACSHGFLPFIKTLSKGKKVEHVNAVDNDGWTPLHWACRRGDPAVVDFLLRKGADIKARTSDRDWTPWHVAMFHDNLDIARRVRPEDQTFDESSHVVVA